MRIALFSDIHGNAVALEAVLADIAAQGGVDEYWILGDLVAVGPQPLAVLERVAGLPNARFTRGNTDVYIATGGMPSPSQAEVIADLAWLPIFEEVARTMAWTQGAVATGGWLPFLDGLPLEQRLTLPNGTRLLGVHASPGQDSGDGLRPDYPEAFLRAQIADCAADLVCAGHTHWPMNMRLDNTHVVNLGSLSNHRVPGLAAWYVLLEADATGYRLQHRPVQYDREAVIANLQAIRHPAQAFIVRHLQGKHLCDWPLPQPYPFTYFSE